MGEARLRLVERPVSLVRGRGLWKSVIDGSQKRWKRLGWEDWSHPGAQGKGKLGLKLELRAQGRLGGSGEREKSKGGTPDCPPRASQAILEWAGPLPPLLAIGVQEAFPGSGSAYCPGTPRSSSRSPLFFSRSLLSSPQNPNTPNASGGGIPLLQFLRLLQPLAPFCSSLGESEIPSDTLHCTQRRF